ncbi:LysR family transcriptional regulator [uncultured Roseovarius sp.]|uniref:LysR family transcriptional regulator n=1 Tax=uncultured Roseovarius sp. TaxID=293344 RepID=UPI002626EFBE|nr:LysR family transcriptional regulator [uncultured Roseovarius sp.]
MTSEITSFKLIVMKDDFNEIELRKLDLNLLLVFSALMRERSVSEAANRLYLGPSAVSMALRRLRDAIGDPLFVRTNKGMEPTRRADEIWRLIAPALGAIDGAVRPSEAFDPSTAKLDIRVALPDDLEFVLLPRLLKRLAAEAPGIRLIVRPSDFRTLLDRLDDGDADLALSATPTSGIEQRHHIKPLHRESFSVLYDAKMTEVSSNLDLDTWLAHPHVLLTIRGDLHSTLDERLADSGRSRNILVGISHFPTAPFVLRSMPSFLSMPSLAASHFASTYDLEIAKPPLDVGEFEVSLAWHARTHADVAHSWFRKTVDLVVSKIRYETFGPTVG